MTILTVIGVYALVGMLISEFGLRGSNKLIWQGYLAITLAWPILATVAFIRVSRRR